MGSRHDDTRPVKVATAPNPVIASIWVDLLRQEGIAATIKCDDPLASAYMITSPYPCQILAPANQADRARGLLDNLVEGDATDEPDTDGDS